MSIFGTIKRIVQRELWQRRLNRQLSSQTIHLNSQVDKLFKLSIFDGEIAPKLNNFFYVINDYDIGGLSKGELTFTPQNSVALKGHISTQYYENMQDTPNLGIQIKVLL